MMAQHIKPNPLIKEFVRLLDNLEDSGKNMHQFMDFLSTVLRYKESVPPTAEFVTVLKYRKPILFQHLKKNISPRSPLYFVLQLDMDYNLAAERIGL